MLASLHRESDTTICLRHALQRHKDLFKSGRTSDLQNIHLSIKLRANKNNSNGMNSHWGNRADCMHRADHFIIHKVTLFSSVFILSCLWSGFRTRSSLIPSFSLSALMQFPIHRNRIRVEESSKQRLVDSNTSRRCRAIQGYAIWMYMK